MDEKILKSLVDSFVKEFITEAKVICTGIYDEGKQFIGKSVKNYLNKQREKYSNIKTLLRGNTPIFLYEVYYQIDLKIGSAKINTATIKNVFLDGNFVTIIGDAGSGKSTLLKHLFLSSIQEKFAIPIMVELRYLNGTDGDIERYIIEKIFENKLAQNASILERLLENGKFVIFFDGFDELNSEIKNAVVKNLNSFIGLYNQNKYILTSRPYSNIENLPLFRNLEIQKLENKDITDFIDFQLKKEKELAQKIKKSISGNVSNHISSFLSNPLLLTLYILTFQSYAEVPEKKYIFYRRVINALFSEHDSKTKLGYVREKISQLNQEEFEEILKAFSAISYTEAQYVFDYDYVNGKINQIKQKIKTLKFDNNKFVSDLKSAISLWTEDNGYYSFAHRSLQEYFAASFIKNLNPEDNLKAYQTIKRTFGDNKRPLGDYENFLSLCQEMDKVNFYKNYSLPLLNELRSVLDNSSREMLVSSFVTFFTEGVYKQTIKSSGKDSGTNIGYSIIVNDKVYYTIYFHLAFTQKLFGILNSLTGKIPEKYFTNFSKNRHGDLVCSFEKGVPSEILQLLIHNKVDSIATDLLLNTEKLIEETEAAVSQSVKTDRDLLSLLG